MPPQARHSTPNYCSSGSKSKPTKTAANTAEDKRHSSDAQTEETNQKKHKHPNPKNRPPPPQMPTDPSNPHKRLPRFTRAPSASTNLKVSLST
eukprot:1423610-Amphidinium_carterae.1